MTIIIRMIIKKKECRIWFFIFLFCVFWKWIHFLLTNFFSIYWLQFSIIRFLSDVIYLTWFLEIFSVRGQGIDKITSWIKEAAFLSLIMFTKNWKIYKWLSTEKEWTSFFSLQKLNYLKKFKLEKKNF